ncbi:MAG: hypothetical protein RSD78_05925 [Oscillospiraceae bacterium]
MKRELYEYEVFPKILPSDKESRITLRSLAYHTAFKKEEKYTLRVLPLCQSHDPQKDDTYPSYTARVQADGTLCLTHCFCGEQEHCIRILREDGTKLVDLSVYSVLSDLYALRPYLGDMHSHTCFSDGKEAPEFVAARYREEGFDFLAITDHRRYEPSLRAIDFYKDVNIDLYLVPGEEIHAPNHNVHTVNFGGKYSVNDMWRNDENGFALEIADIEKTLSLPQGVSSYEIAVCIWEAEHIKKGGGLSIFCHPFWKNNAYQVPIAVTEYLLRNKIHDAFELVGGQTEKENMQQTLLYNQLRTEGVNPAVVGNSDSHNTINGKDFNVLKTMVFAQSCTREALIDAVKSHYSVAIDSYVGAHYHVHGEYRLASYAAFLLEEYFPLHQELCKEEGRLMRRLVAGDSTAASGLNALSGRCNTLLEHCF